MLKGWGNCLGYLGKGKNTKEWWGDKDFKKEGGKLGQDVSSNYAWNIRTMKASKLLLNLF